jgi:ubiquitin C-terminal hydrolase
LDFRVHNKEIDIESVKEDENTPLNTFYQQNTQNNKIMYSYGGHDSEEMAICMPPFGLINPKYNCYMNSLIQCYLSIEQFV